MKSAWTKALGVAAIGAVVTAMSAYAPKAGAAGGYNYRCRPNTSTPCLTCNQGNMNRQCMPFSLGNGYQWGTCDVSYGYYCDQTTSDCGKQEYDCQNPPNAVASSPNFPCRTLYDICK